MTILFIHLPPRLAADHAADGLAPQCTFALMSDKGRIAQEGSQPLADLAPLVAQAQQVVLLLAASDVTLLQLAVPPLSAAKLKAALPHLVEEHLIVDPLDCVIVAGPLHAGMRMIAVIQRDWLALLAKALLSMGARSLRALPSQLCLPLQNKLASAALYCHDTQNDLSIRLSEQAGLGLSILPGNGQSTAQETLSVLRALLPDGAIHLYLPATEIKHYATLLKERASDITLRPQDWTQTMTEAVTCPIDLISGLSVAASGQGIPWRAWRQPLLWASAVLLLNVAALNLDWWQLRSESAQLTSSMFKAYRSAYPRETVVIDPIAQARQKIALSQAADGQLAPDDFIVLAAQFRAAWNSVGAQIGKASVASMQYHDRSLSVQLANRNDSDALSAPLAKALAGHGLRLSQTSAGQWQITLSGDEK